MFKWCCLGVAVVALLVLGWMVNDMRLAVRQQTDRLNEHLPKILERVDKTTKIADEHLPPILERVDRTTKAVSEHLPPILEKAEASAETVAVVSEDVKQLKQLWDGVNPKPRDQTLVAYADGVLTLIESQNNAAVGVKKLTGKGLKDPLPAREWAAAARKEATGLTFVSKTRAELLTSLCRKYTRSDWHIQFGDGEPVRLIDWVKENHPDSKDVK